VEYRVVLKNLQNLGSILIARYTVARNCIYGAKQSTYSLLSW